LSREGTLTLFNDTAPPLCVVDGPHRGSDGRLYIDITVQDQGSGLELIGIILQDNADIHIDGFTRGTTGPVHIRATKVYAALSTRVGFEVTDRVWNSRTCDPTVTEIRRLADTTGPQIFKGIPKSEHVITISNGAPGVRLVEVRVNGSLFRVPRLRNSEKRSLDISSAMVPGHRNVIALEGRGGGEGASAAAMIWDGHGDP